MTVDLSKGATVELVKTLSDDIRLGADGTIYNSAGDAVRNSANSAYVVQSESGNPIAIDDGANDIPVKELIVNLEPKQSGTGDPSPTNVRPITGYDGVKVKRIGKNLLQVKYTGRVNNGVTYTLNSDGSVALSGTASSSSYFASNYGFNTDYMTKLKAGQYTLSGGSENIRVYGTAYSLDGNLIKNIYQDTGSGTTFEVNEDFWLSPQIYVVSGTVTNKNVYLQIELGSTATEYEPYTEQEYSITFPSSVGTVYGGTLNVTTGELTVDRKMEVINSVSGISRNNAKQYYIGATRLPDIKNATSIELTVISDKFKPSTSGDGVIFLSTSGNVRFNTTEEYASTADMMADIESFEVCYPLATPTTYQLTPTEVSTLLGSNTISSDGSMELQYRADTTKVIEKLTNAIISLGGNV